MISFRQIARFVGAEPFRITTTRGRTHDIRHPEMIQVGRSYVTIYTFLSDDETDAKEHQVEVSLLLTETVEPLDPASQPRGA